MMESTRRDFLKSAGIAIGAAAVWAPEWAAADSVDKDRLADSALSTAKRLGASYADIRVNRYRNESISTRERQVQSVNRSESFGFGVRVLVKGAWGFAASRITTPEEAQKVTEQAVETARANAEFQRKRVELVTTPKVVADWKSAFQKDPFDVPVDEKIAFLLGINEAALKVKGVSFVTSRLALVNEQKYLATSDGSRIQQTIIRSYPAFSVTAVNR